MTDEAVVAAPATARRRRRRRLAPLIALVAVAVLAPFIVVLAGGQPAVDRFAKSPLLGKPAPALQGNTIDGTVFRLADHKGTWVVVNFFAPWCTGCRQEHPALISFSAQHQVSADAELVGVIFNDTPDNVRAFRRDLGGDWPLVIDPNGSVGVDYGVSALPETFVIDPSGYVRAKFSSPVSAAGLNRVLDSLRSP